MKPRYDLIKHDQYNEIMIDVPIEKVYEWIKTGKWSLGDYKKWLKLIRVI